MNAQSSKIRLVYHNHWISFICSGEKKNGDSERAEGPDKGAATKEEEGKDGGVGGGEGRREGGAERQE